MSLRRNLLLLPLLAASFASSLPAQLPPDNAYIRWARARFGDAVVADPAQKATVWGEAADPDGDQLLNLVEYLSDTDPLAKTPASSSFFYSVTPAAGLSGRRGQITAWQRTDDPDLHVVVQTSPDMQNWWPPAPLDFADPLPMNAAVTTTETGATSRGLRQMRYQDIQDATSRPAAFMRLLVVRGNARVAAPGLEPFSFTFNESVASGAVVQSNTVIVQGFSGTLTISIPATNPQVLRIYVNGVLQPGTSAGVRAGDAVWLEATAPSTVGSTRNYVLTAGSYSAAWRFTTAALAAVSNHPGATSGYTPVESSVSESGAAQISIPIFVSPGVAGMQPKLAITYSSQGGNGPLGTGFSLTGLGVISRTGATKAQDGFKGGISLSPTDRFALDGQRLLAVQGVDGGNGTEYRSEFDPTTRIRSLDADGTGPGRWVVETKAGIRMDYGTTGASRVKVEVVPELLMWALETMRDSVGNEIRYTYDPAALTWAEVLVTKIEYTANTGQGLASKQQVLFEYEDRPDLRGHFVGGGLTFMKRRLKAIESQATNGGGLMTRVRRYELSYEQAEITSASQLVQVLEILADGTQMPPTTFTWHKSSAPAFNVSTNTGVLANPPFDRSPPASVLQGDFNADGRMDTLKMNDYQGTRAPGDHWIGFGSNSGSLTYSTPIPDLQTRQLSNNNDWSRLRSCDLNGDGKTDFLHLYTTAGPSHFAALARGDGSFQLIPSTSLGDLKDQGFSPGTLSEFLMLDFNGDGISDAIYLKASAHAVYLGNGDGSFTKKTNLGGLTGVNYGSDVSGGGGSWILPGDYNGDGKADLLHLYYSGGVFNWLALSVGDGSFNVTQTGSIVGIPAASYGNTSTQFVTGDFNGDGLTDVVKLEGSDNASSWIALSKGDGKFHFMSPISGIVGAPASGTGTSHFVVGDFNGDGSADILHVDTNPANCWIAYSIGHGRFVRWQGAAALGDLANRVYSSGLSSRVMAGDYDGDGTDDILHLQYQGENYLARANGFDRPYVVKVTNGHGGSASFTYKPMTDPSVYTKGSGLTYPCIDFTSPMWVVSELRVRTGLDVDPLTGGAGSLPGENAMTYRYEGAWTCLDGRGFQGFKAMEVKDETSRIVTRTEWQPLTYTSGNVTKIIGSRPVHAEQRLSPQDMPAGGSLLISSSDTTWQVAASVQPSGRTTYFASEAGSIARSYEINAPAASAQIRTVTRGGPASNGGKILYDGYANVLEMTTTTTVPGVPSETYTEIVVNTYADAPTPTRWHLGRLATSTVAKTAPNPETQVGGFTSSTRSSAFAYEANTGLLTQEVIEPAGGALRQQKDYVHDALGNIATSTLSTQDAAPRTTTTFYTTDGRFVRETRNALGHTETKTYDPLLGTVLSQTGPNDLVTTWDYDALGRPTAEHRPDGTISRSFYRLVTGSTTDAPPRAVHYVRVQSTGGAPRTVWYDLLDREIQTDAVGYDAGGAEPGASGTTISSRKIYNPRGEVIQASQPFFAGQTPLYSVMAYDAVGRETDQTDPGSRLTKTTYAGFTTTIERTAGSTGLSYLQKAVTVVNAMGWTVQSSQFLDGNPKPVSRRYDAYGNLRFVSDPLGNTTEIRYDVRGNKVWMREPNAGVSTFAYNGFSELVSQQNAAGEITALAYDVLGRVTARTEREGTTTFEFDTSARGLGLLAREEMRPPVVAERGSQPDFSRSYFYDALSRPRSTVQQHGGERFATSRGYDANGRPATMTFPTGFAVRQNYTALGHLRSVENTASGLPYWTASLANARGQVEREALGNGILTERTFEPETGLIASIRSSFKGSGGVQNLAFQFDLIGNLKSRRDVRFSTPFEETFAYDTLNRLTQVSATNTFPYNVGYNDLGNVTGRGDFLGSFTYGQNGAGPHAVTAVSSPLAGYTKTCTYDNKGNRITDGATSLSYASFNKPTRIKKGNDTLTFDYGSDRAVYRQTIFRVDGQGRETQNVRHYVGGMYEREVDSIGGVRHIHYIAGGNGVVAIQTDESNATAPLTGRLRYIHKDHLGSVDAISDEGGGVLERHSFDAWGKRRKVDYLGNGSWQVSDVPNPAASAGETHRGFTGHEMLDLVGLVHMGGRVYDPLTARFLSPDPFVQSPDNLQNLNRYSYVLNNPLSMTDPSGFFFKSIAKFVRQHGRTIVALGVGILSGGLAVWTFAGPGVTFFGALGAALGTSSSLAVTTFGAALFGAGFGFGTAFSGSLLAGGSIGDAFRAGIASGVLGALSAGLTHGIAGRFGLQHLRSSDTNFFGKLATKVIAHGSIQGGLAELQGGSFRHGFLSGAITGAASPYISAHVGENFQVLAAAAVGGTASSLGGGKFGNGAVSGAFVYLFNQVSKNLGDSTSSAEFKHLAKEMSDLECPSNKAAFLAEHGSSAVYRNDGLTNLATCGSYKSCDPIQIWVTDTSSGLECAYHATTGEYIPGVATYNMVNPEEPVTFIFKGLSIAGYQILQPAVIGDAIAPSALRHFQSDMLRKWGVHPAQYHSGSRP